MKIYHTLLSVFVLLYLSNPIAAQTEQEKIKKADNDFGILLHFKREYEMLDKVSKTHVNKKAERDSMYNKYVQKAKTIRENADFYLPVIDVAIKNGRVESKEPERILYNYVDTSKPFDPHL